MQCIVICSLDGASWWITTMVPETRLCAYCKSKIPPEKRADAKFCSHACKLSAHRKEERADAAHKESVAPMQPVVTKIRSSCPPCSHHKTTSTSTIRRGFPDP